MIRQFMQGAEERKWGMGFQVALLTALMLLSYTAARAQQVTRTQLNTSEQNGKLTFSANVSNINSSPLETGSVSFETAKGSLGSAFVKNGKATLTVNSLPPGVKEVAAVYHPATSDYAASMSTPAQATGLATSTVPSFNVTASPTSATVTAGNYTTIQLTINSVNGFKGKVDLSCSSLPAHAGCTFTPSSLTPPANGSAKATLQITTQAASGVSKNVVPTGVTLFHRGGGAYLAFLLPGGIALLGVFTLRRKQGSSLRMLGMVALLAVFCTGLTACGARYGYLLHKPFPNYGTPTGTYSVVVSAYSSNGTSVQQATTSTSSNCTGAVCVALTVK